MVVMKLNSNLTDNKFLYHITAFNKTDQSYILDSLVKDMGSIDLGHTENEWGSKKKKRSVIIAYDVLEK